MRLFSIGILGLVLALAGCDPRSVGPRRDAGHGSADGGFGPDADGDGISDSWEGSGDTDGDGTPDFEDPDTDEDGIPDSVEANVNITSGEPADSDSDGTYDFRDDDSDDNGILDIDETDGDLDGDGAGDFRDRDDDGDFITDRDERGTTPTPPDADGDGMPDFRDYDSDDDNISDANEGFLDSDHDGTIDRFDNDSDHDGLTDATEAGDTDARTPAIDSDEDGKPNYRDPDSDNDGLGDTDESLRGTDLTLADTDGDGVSDLIEVGACPTTDAGCRNDATDPASNPRTRGDFVFVVPYMEPQQPPRDTLDFGTALRKADVYFLIDTTGSMSTPINSVRTSLSTATTGIIDRVRATISDAWFGVGAFRDAGDTYLYQNTSDITSVPSTAQAGVNTLAAGGGGDGPEGAVPALWSTATGSGVSSIPARSAACATGRFGYPCFRSDAVPIVVMITDAPFHNGPTGTNPYSSYTNYATMISAVQSRQIRVVGVAVGSGGEADLRTLATDSGAVNTSGAPLVTRADTGVVSSAVVTQIETLAASTRFDINLTYNDDTTDAVDSYAAFVDHLEANTAGVSARNCAPRAAEDTNGDGHPDTFRSVLGGPTNRVCFDIIVKRNDTVAATESPQVFRATLRVIGDGFTELDSRDVFFLVPGIIPDLEGPM